MLIYGCSIAEVANALIIISLCYRTLCLVYILAPSSPVVFEFGNLHQAMREAIIMCSIVIALKITSFLYSSTASAPIQSTAARVKYWISADMAVHTISFSFRSIPTKKINSKHNSEMESWKLIFVRFRWRSSLQV